jgi:hypothetical protein
VREQVGPDFPLLYRYSVEEPYEGGLSMDDGLAFAEMLEPLVDAFDVSAGNYDTAMTLLPMVPPGSLLKYAKAVKQRVSKPVIGVGRLVWLLDDVAKAVDDGEMDFVATPKRPCSRRCGWRSRASPGLGDDLGIGQPCPADELHGVAARPHRWPAAPTRVRRSRAEVDSMVVFYGRELERLGVDVRLATDAADLGKEDRRLAAGRAGTHDEHPLWAWIRMTCSAGTSPSCSLPRA